MRLFNQKPGVGLQEFCRQFYDNVIFQPTIVGQRFDGVWWDNIFHSVVETDKSFAVMDKSILAQEMTALRLELFGLAWVYKFAREKFTIPQSIFTRQYLERNGKSETWDIMGEYSQVIAQSAFLTDKGEQMDGRAGRARITFVNEFRWGIFKKWAEANMDNPSAPTEEEKKVADCVARVVNRMLVDIRNDDCILVKRLAARLAERLGCDANLNAEALFALRAVVFGLYESARRAIKDIKLD